MQQACAHMGLLCCFSAPATVEEKPVINAPAIKVPEPDVGQSARAAAEDKAASLLAPASAQQKDVDKPWSKLNENESAAVKQTLLKVGWILGVPGGPGVMDAENCGWSSADAIAACETDHGQATVCFDNIERVWWQAEQCAAAGPLTTLQHCCSIIAACRSVS